MDHKSIQNGKIISEGPIYAIEILGKVYEADSIEHIADAIVADKEMSAKLGLANENPCRAWSFVNSNLYIAF